MRYCSLIFSLFFFFAVHHCLAEDIILGGNNGRTSSETCPVNGSEHKHGNPCKIATSGVQKISSVQAEQFKGEVFSGNSFFHLILNSLNLGELNHQSDLINDVFNNVRPPKSTTLLLNALKLAPNAPPIKI